MRPNAINLLLVLLSGFDLSESFPGHHDVSPPSVRLSNGTYVGVRNEEYAQDFFLGIPYAQPPIGSLRYAAPQPLNSSFEETRNATEYGWMCIGYGSDTANLGNPVSEDCLTINIVRPAGTKPGDDLPVGIWVHGGSYVNGGSRDPRYNLSYIVEQSVKENKPIIAASINYRLSYWGFLFSQELQDVGAGNIGFRDQRLALRWLQENISPFGGSPDKVTIWGESAGARSLGMQLIAYDGQHDNLFRSAILESGSSVAKFVGADAWQPYFEALLAKTGCADASDRLACVRALPWQTLNAIFNGTNPLSATTLLAEGKFAPVPLLLGNNFDEGTGYAKQGINTTEQFESWLASSLLIDSTQIAALKELYPDDPAEVAFVFNNVNGLGYAANPFEGKPQSYVQLADKMSKMWVAFIHDTDPNQCNGWPWPWTKGLVWPQYTPDQPLNLVFNENSSKLGYIERDDYRATEIAYIQEHVYA
ncbi:hypothetical protein COL922a_013324 [Colletotrichum nupharicola]|nr:hypothetical protein COL922a_013324 [Colletotrichum nupharicola]